MKVRIHDNDGAHDTNFVRTVHYTPGGKRVVSYGGRWWYLEVEDQQYVLGRPADPDSVSRNKPMKKNSRKRTPASKRMGAALKKWIRKNPRIKLPAKWTPAKVRVDQIGNVQVKLSASKVGAGRVARGIKSVKKA
jgi:hypothetical protein